MRRGAMTFISLRGLNYLEEVAKILKRIDYFCYDSPVKVEIKATYPDKRRRDLDNLLKVSMDALTKNQVWTDDSLIHDLRIYKSEVIDREWGGNIVVTISFL